MITVFASLRKGDCNTYTTYILKFHTEVQPAILW